MSEEDKNLFTELVKNLTDGKLSHNHIQMAYRDSVRKRTDIPDAIKNLLTGTEDSSGLLAPLFRCISQSIGALELAWRRGYQAGWEEALEKNRKKVKP